MISASTRAPVDDCAWRLMNLETAPTAPQKTPDAAGPMTFPPGSCGLVDRIPSIQVIGVLHWGFSYGPVGPLLLRPTSFWPQRPR